MTSPASESVFSREVIANRIVYFDRGTGPVLVLIHGMFGDYLDWEPVLAPLSRNYRLIAVDLIGPQLGMMRGKLIDRYTDRLHCLIRLTEAQDPFFATLDANLPGYRAIETPTLIMTGAEDRTIPPWVQRKLCDILPVTRFELVQDSGHVVYLEKPEIFFGNLKKFIKAKSLQF